MRLTMLPDDAHLYFPVEEGMDPVDKYNEVLFEQKQYFLSGIPWSKTYAARFNKLEKVQLAYDQLYGTTEYPVQDAFVLEVLTGEELESVYKTYQRNKTQIYLRINQSKTINDLMINANLLLENRMKYALKWNDAQLEVANSETLRETDPVTVLKEMELVKTKGVVAFNQVSDLERENPVYQEGIQLSLWLNKETNG